MNPRVPRVEKSALIALRELRAIEEARVSDEEQRRARIEDEARRQKAEAEQQRLSAELLARERQLDEVDVRARLVEERARRKQLALDGARLEGQLVAARMRIAELDAAQPRPAPALNTNGWMLGCILGTGASLVLATLLALAPPTIREHTVYLERPSSTSTVFAARSATTATTSSSPKESSAAPAPISATTATPPPRNAPRSHRPAHDSHSKPDPMLDDCDGDPLCHMDGQLNDLHPAPHARVH